MEPLDEAIARAFERGEALRRREPRAVAARYDRVLRRLVLSLQGDGEIAIPVAALGLPEEADLSDVRVEGGGFDLYFPSLDEGAYIPDLCRAAIEHRLAA
ncbi:hypothetical protein [Sulfuricystis multivorans]|uniref:hypothetical protein n=1 Tax=Sulfuricystis multivorans TaxID=2211108 RepID=UPI000F8428F1|nr:hypothetical protein [Sulfuricystis multivorans]